MMQRYRADRAVPQDDGSTIWYPACIYPTTATKISNCRLETLAGAMRRTVYITGEAATWFSIPACCRIQGARVTGYVTRAIDDDGFVFRHTYY